MTRSVNTQQQSHWQVGRRQTPGKENGGMAHEESTECTVRHGKRSQDFFGACSMFLFFHMIILLFHQVLTQASDIRPSRTRTPRTAPRTRCQVQGPRQGLGWQGRPVAAFGLRTAGVMVLSNTWFFLVFAFPLLYSACWECYLVATLLPLHDVRRNVCI